MTTPFWITPPGDLGTIVEGEFYQIQLNAGNASTYRYLSGNLPAGIRITANGSVEGYVQNLDYIQGIPKEVGVDTTSRFVVRATSDDGLVADRVFQLTVTGPDAPVIDALPASNLGVYFDGDLIQKQLTALDPDPGDTLTWSFAHGEIPGGLTVSSSGLLSGYINPIPKEDGKFGFDEEKFDIYSYDFRTLSVNKTYEFTVQVTDGTFISTKQYTMFVQSRNSLTADNTDITTDSFYPTALSTDINSIISADQTSFRNPVITTPPTSIGTIKHDNFFAFQIESRDFDGDELEYEITTGAGLGYDGSSYDVDIFDRGGTTLPPGLTLNTTSGWLTGYIPQQSATTIDYVFAVRVKKTNNPIYTSDFVFFTMTIEGDIDNNVTWPSSNLGTISTGQISELYVTAAITNNVSVRYELKEGYSNKLPQGLVLNDKGLITGRVSFESMMFDTGTTTFDVNQIKFNETTFERSCKFTVRVFSNDGFIDTFQTFTLTINQSMTKPYESLYGRALPNVAQRNIYQSVIQNYDDIEPDDIYRPSDSNFGVQTDIRFLIAAGLNPAKITAYVSATAKNHWNNTLRFGDYKTARALDASGNPKYEIVYIELVDKSMGVNPTTKVAEPAADTIQLNLQNGWTNPLTIDSTWPKVSGSLWKTDQKNDTTVYPNAIQNMRNRMLDSVGSAILERKVLPDWMQDKQTNGKTIGWKLAVPVVYCKPGTAERIKFRLEQRTSIDPKRISFEVDRLIIDNNLSKHYNKETGKWTTSQETTFDLAEISNTPVATVDYSISTARFDSLNGVKATLVAANSITGVGDITSIGSTGVTVIWTQEENLLGITENNGWNKYVDSFGESAYDSKTWDKVESIPGFTAKQIGASSVNQRMGVWRISVNSSGYVVCTFVREIYNGEQVKVDYDNLTYYYERTASTGTVPKYVDVRTVNLLTGGAETYFDGGGTRFMANVDVYANKDEGDSYLKFPRVNVFR